MFWILVFVVFLLVLIDVLLNRNEKANKFRKVPGPGYKFIFGNGLDYAGTPVRVFGLLRQYANQWNRIYRFWSFGIAAVNIYTPEDIELIISTTKHNDKSDIYKLMKPWLQDGLLVSNGAKWQERRKILTPAFHFNILKRFFPIIEENSLRLVDNLKKCEQNETDVVPLLSEYTLSSICETAMGIKLSEEMSGGTQLYKAAIYKLGHILLQRLITILLFFDPIFNLSSLGKEQNKYVDIVRQFTSKVINERKRSFVANEVLVNSQNDEVYGGNKKRLALLDLLLLAENDNLLDDKGIQEEVDTFMFEGHDTTAAGLTYCLMLMANHKDIQDRAFEEIQSIFGKSDREANYEDLSNMKYLECCIKESLRLYPPVPLISRRLSEPVTIGEYTIPEDTFCHIHIYDLHRRKDLYPNPLKFDPDRFLTENCIGRHPFAYIPFSAGPRNCIGQRFAMMEMKSALSAVLRRFELVPVTRPMDLHMAADLVLRSSKPVQVCFMKR